MDNTIVQMINNVTFNLEREGCKNLHESRLVRLKHSTLCNKPNNPTSFPMRQLFKKLKGQDAFCVTAVFFHATPIFDVVT